MKKLLKLLVVAALAVSMTLCCVACGANYSPVTEENAAEVATKFSDKLDEDVPVGTATKDDQGNVTKYALNLGAFLDLEADLTLDGIGIKGKTKDELVLMTAVDQTEPNNPKASVSAKFKTEDSLSFKGTKEDLAALMDKIGEIDIPFGIAEYKEGDAEEEPRVATLPEALIGSLLNKSVTGSGEIALVDGVVYLSEKAEMPGAKEEAKLMADLKPIFGGAEGYNWIILNLLEEKIYAAIEEYGAYITKDNILMVLGMSTTLGLKVSADLGSYALKLESTAEFNEKLPQLLAFLGIQLGENEKLDIKTLALTLNLDKDGKISSVKLELNVVVDMTYSGIAIKGFVKGSLELKTDGLSVSAPSNTGDYFDISDIVSSLISNRLR